MSLAEKTAAVLIHFLFPCLWLLYFLYLANRMHREKIPQPPYLSLLMLFAMYGLLIFLILTAIFWKWSGLASLGAFALLAGTPLPAAGVAFLNYRRRQRSLYHLWIFRAAFALFILILLTDTYFLIRDFSR